MQSTLSPLQKSIHLLLVVYAGFIGPLSYFNFYSPHRVANSYHLSILEDPTRIYKLALIRQVMNRDKNSLLISQLIMPGSTMSEYAFVPNLSQNLQDVLGYVYTSIEGERSSLQQNFFCRVTAYNLIAKSAYLPPPEKPPPVSHLYLYM